MVLKYLIILRKTYIWKNKYGFLDIEFNRYFNRNDQNHDCALIIQNV